MKAIQKFTGKENDASKPKLILFPHSNLDLPTRPWKKTASEKVLVLNELNFRETERSDGGEGMTDRRGIAGRSW